MGFLSSLFGSPKRAPTPAAEIALGGMADQMRSETAAYAPVIKNRMATLTDQSGEIARARGTANADVMQTPLMGLTPFQRAMRRGSALAKIAMQGEGQVQQQGLRDRIAMSRFGTGIRSGTAQSLSGLGESQGMVDAANMRAKQDMNSALWNVAGTGLGMYARHKGWGVYGP